MLPHTLLRLLGMMRRGCIYLQDGLNLMFSMGAYGEAIAILIVGANWRITIRKPAPSRDTKQPNRHDWPDR